MTAVPVNVITVKVNTMPSTLIIGASSSIAKSLRDLLLQQGESVIAVSRQKVDIDHPSLKSLQCDYSEAMVADVCNQLLVAAEPIIRVVMFFGVLHNDEFMPEKKLEDWSQNRFEQTFHVNTWLPMLWVSNLAPLLCSSFQRALPRVSITALSARVGSISDNKLGGWYSYRSSKAALNMALKTAAVELARRAPNTKLIAFHPGTTDTALSKPFQARVSPDKLFTPEFVAKRLLTAIDAAPRDGSLSYVDWDNKPIPW